MYVTNYYLENKFVGAPFKKFASKREEWALKNRYLNPGMFSSHHCFFCINQPTFISLHERRILYCSKSFKDVISNYLFLSNAIWHCIIHFGKYDPLKHISSKRKAIELEIFQTLPSVLCRSNSIRWPSC